MHKAVDHDYILPCFLHIAADEIASHLQYFFEFLFLESVFPESCTILKKQYPFTKKGIELIPLTTNLFEKMQKI